MSRLKSLVRLRGVARKQKFGHRILPFLYLVLYLTLAAELSGQDRIHIWVKAFIPSAHPGNPGYVLPIPNTGLFVIHEPVGALCALTDNRGFSPKPTASARMTTEFVLAVTNGVATVSPFAARPLTSTGASHRVDCRTGVDLVPSKTASSNGMHIGHPADADGVAQVVFDANASYPFITNSPDVTYSGTVTFDASAKTLRFQGSSKNFPAYEAYAQLNDGPVATLFKLDPAPGTTVMSLIDAGTGLSQRSIDVTVKLLDGASP